MDEPRILDLWYLLDEQHTADQPELGVAHRDSVMAHYGLDEQTEYIEWSKGEDGWFYAEYVNFTLAFDPDGILQGADWKQDWNGRQLLWDGPYDRDIADEVRLRLKGRQYSSFDVFPDFVGLLAGERYELTGRSHDQWLRVTIQRPRGILVVDFEHDVRKLQEERRAEMDYFVIGLSAQSHKANGEPYEYEYTQIVDDADGVGHMSKVTVKTRRR